jgi:hypothetical protein
MVFAARDFFEAGLRPPSLTSPPSSGPLFTYLSNRLFDSFNLPNGPVTYTYLMDPDLPDHDTLFSSIGLAPHGRAWITINEQWPHIKSDLDAGRLSPVALVLVKDHDVTKMGHNHQVLAWGYDLSANQDLSIHVYDPNAPLDDSVTVSLNIANPSATTDMFHSDGTRVWAFFQQQYSFVSPLGLQATGPAACVFPSASTVCTSRARLQYDTTWSLPASCPAVTGNWILEQIGGGAVPTAPEANTWAIGHQAEGAVVSGPAIGSTSSYVVCDAPDNCSRPFNLTVSDCHTQLDSVYVAYNRTLIATQGSSGYVTLEEVGPWMNYDYGVNAQGSVVSTNLPNASFNFGAGYSNNTACYPNCIGFMSMSVSPSFTSPAGDYTATVKVVDPATQIAVTSTVPIHVDPCTPPPESCGTNQCGDISGCGQTLHCGTCSTGNVCSNGYCCPSGTQWDGNACAPLCHCEPGFYCTVNGTCARNQTCKPGRCM